MGRQEFEDLVVRQLEAYTEKPADIHDLRNACRHVLAFSLTTSGGLVGGGGERDGLWALGRGRGGRGVRGG